MFLVIGVLYSKNQLFIFEKKKEKNQMKLHKTL